ncbi:unnamed protein product [Acanthoscelides obtectus]|uniref:Zinc-finger domain-containing protein n=1 Tax=Acanthoscelides obtectus TaxID=200917 RepID=A0A9P0Q4W4_ACAOB|nr:unnamed protein product [Acanthoscelides obtectus]CAK1638765.1 hypothetical protein AOBTE_LOCUS10809 [Acanthoscelides obtectus]
MDPCTHESPFEALRTSPVSSEREEGEIVDDEFEDISDNSISLPYSVFGKSVSSREHLPAIYLSSVSEDDSPIFYDEKPIRKRKKTYRKRKHRKRVTSKSDSDEFAKLDKVLQEQLKAAIRVDNDSNEEQKNNSLRTRLRGMSKKECILEEKQSNSNSEELDPELYALRSEALKTAVLNKFKYRKRKLKDIVKTPPKDCLENVELKLENDTNIIEPQNKVICIEHVEVPQKQNENLEETEKEDNDEDEDVLRALLLASMTKKMTKNTENFAVKSTETIASTANPLIKPEYKIISRSEKQTIFKTHPLQLPKVKPLIINLNDDSDSEDNSFIKKSDVPLKPNPPINNIVDIESAVDAFLKSQRAKVEAKEVLKQESTKDKLEKSCVKLLPKNKQLEYKNLIKRLEDAKKMKLKKTTLKTNVVGKVNTKNNKNRVLINKHIEVNKKGPSNDINEDLKLLHKTLKEMQVNKDGRSQIQHKYASLLPTIKKITDSSSERKKYDEQVKKILQELNEAKKKSIAAHQTFSIHVKELVAKKEEIDKKVSKNVANHVVTSTPMKKTEKITDLLNEISTNTLTSNPNKENGSDKDQVEIMSKDNIAGKCIETDMNDTGQPNGNIPQYVSPLDTVNRIINDPFSIMCPYDIDGNCCDAECIYNHYCEK